MKLTVKGIVLGTSMAAEWDEHGGGVNVFRRAPSLWSFFQSLMKNFDASKAKGQTNDFFVIISRV